VTHRSSPVPPVGRFLPVRSVRRASKPVFVINKTPRVFNDGSRDKLNRTTGQASKPQNESLRWLRRQPTNSFHAPLSRPSRSHPLTTEEATVCQDDDRVSLCNKHRQESWSETKQTGRLTGSTRWSQCTTRSTPAGCTRIEKCAAALEQKKRKKKKEVEQTCDVPLPASL
jgi:hypothetical protein